MGLANKITGCDRTPAGGFPAAGAFGIYVHVPFCAHTCEFCLECTRLTGCPGLTIEETSYGPKMSTDLSHCVSDMACTRVKACPAFEELTIHRSHKPAARPLPDPASLPAPQVPSFEGDWRTYIAGVGGMGIGSSTAVLVRAGLKHGYHVTFCDKKGIAIRNGGVSALIRRRNSVPNNRIRMNRVCHCFTVILKHGESVTAVLPAGTVNRGRFRSGSTLIFCQPSKQPV